MTTFQRARSEEQRAVRRQAILDAAAGMLAELPVADVTLNELARRAGLAKSNVLRYFESREAVLLELLDDALRAWLGRLAGLVRSAVDPAAAEATRIDLVAHTIARSLDSERALCDLIGAQAAVLEHNVSAEVAARYKHATVARAAELGALVSSVLPELGEDALIFGGAATMTAGAVWSHSHPSAAMLQAYAADPALAAMRLDFTRALEQLLAVLLAGLLVRRSQGRAGGMPVAGPPAE